MDLIVTSLSSWYGQAQALRDVDVTVNSGEVVGLLGRNGAGKTTLLRSIAGLHSHRSGSIKVGGEESLNATTTTIARKGLSFVREAGALPLSMTVEDNLRLGARLGAQRSGNPGTLEEVWESFPLLSELRKRAAGVLSGGERQTLALAVAYISKPQVLLLDEPSAGLSPQTASQVFQLIREWAERSNLTLLVAEQNATLLGELVSRCYLLDVGRVVEEGAVGQLIASRKDASNNRSEKSTKEC